MKWENYDKQSQMSHYNDRREGSNSCSFCQKPIMYINVEISCMIVKIQRKNESSGS